MPKPKHPNLICECGAPAKYLGKCARCYDRERAALGIEEVVKKIEPDPRRRELRMIALQRQMGRIQAQM